MTPSLSLTLQWDKDIIGQGHNWVGKDGKGDTMRVDISGAGAQWDGGGGGHNGWIPGKRGMPY